VPADTNQYFLLIYDQSRRKVDVEEFAADAQRAALEYAEREQQYRDRPEIEVVLVGADSLDTVKKTHSHYFSDSPESLLSDLEQRLTAA
jgi:hypothetical protein